MSYINNLPSNKLRDVGLGVLYVIATPIGNLEDITLRAIRILKEVNYVLCEDKRVTQKLFNRYHIKTRLITYHKFNEKKLLNYVLSLLSSGSNLAIVSDAGTPLVSDPGYRLISNLKENNIRIVPVPGPSALTCSLSMCHFPLDEFLYVGFLPSKRTKRQSILLKLKDRAKVVVIFVAPHDFKKYLYEIYEIYPDLNVFYTRELTKVYEEYWSGEISDLIHIVTTKRMIGEIVFILNFPENGSEVKNKEIIGDELIKKLRTYIGNGLTLREASKFLAKKYAISSRYLYELYLKHNQLLKP